MSQINLCDSRFLIYNQFLLSSFYCSTARLNKKYVYDAIKALDLTKEEKGALRALFLNNPNKRIEAEGLFRTLEDDEIVDCLKNLLKSLTGFR